MAERDIIFCEMKYEHVSQVAEIEAAVFSEPWSYQSFLDTLGKEIYTFYVALCDGKVVGMAGLIKSCDEATVTNVAIIKEWRRQNIAENLLSELMNDAKKKGTVNFTLEVRESNKAAICLYEKLGFRNEGRRPGFYTKPNEAALIYWKRMIE